MEAAHLEKVGQLKGRKEYSAALDPRPCNHVAAQAAATTAAAVGVKSFINSKAQCRDLVEACPSLWSLTRHPKTSDYDVSRDPRLALSPGRRERITSRMEMPCGSRALEGFALNLTIKLNTSGHATGLVMKKALSTHSLPVELGVWGSSSARVTLSYLATALFRQKRGGWVGIVYVMPLFLSFYA